MTGWINREEAITYMNFHLVTPSEKKKAFSFLARNKKGVYMYLRVFFFIKQNGGQENGKSKKESKTQLLLTAK